jgi:NADPH:quinone reductase-like Zn-dependent oxidoreductase
MLMKVIRYDKKSTPYKLCLSEGEKPAPKEHEVLLKVVSVSLNAADYRSMQMGIIPKKKIYGSAVAGVIASVGSNVKDFKPGDAVIGDLADVGFGGLAEFAAAPEKVVALKPANISFDQASTLPVAATTALQALRNKGNIQKEQHVLIVGSSGGVGMAAVQLAHYFGARVTAVCSTRNTEQSLSLGADEVIDYTTTDFLKGTERYDLILGINGNYPLLGYKRLLKSKGTFVVVGGALAQIFKTMFFGWLLSFGGKQLKTLSAKSNSEELAYVAGLMAEGHLQAHNLQSYSLEEGPKAMHELGQGHATGKVIIHLTSLTANEK